MEKQLKKILFITNLPVPYRIDFYNELGKFCDLTVIFEAKRIKNQTFNWKEDTIRNFKAIFLSEKEMQENKIDWHIFKYINKLNYDVIFITNYAYLTETIALLSLKLRGIPYIYEMDGAMAKPEESKLKKSFKSFFLRGAQAYFSPSKITDDYVYYYVNPDAKIFRYPFTSLNEEDILKKPLSENAKKFFRQKLGIKEPKMILAVGQFIHRKGFDVLMKAARKLDKQVGVYIVGGKPTEEYLELQKNLELTHVHFEGFKTKEELADYFKAADIFVHPTREDIWGLVINEAMACSLPVVTTNKCVAGMELITDTQCLIETESVEMLYLAIQRIIDNEILAAELAKQNLNKIAAYTIEKMAQAHVNFLYSHA